MRVRMDMRIEVSVRDRMGAGVLTYGCRGAATDKLEDYIGNASDHSESPAHLTTRRGERVREGQKQSPAALPQLHRQSTHRTRTQKPSLSHERALLTYHKAEGDSWVEVCTTDVSERIDHPHHHTSCMHTRNVRIRPSRVDQLPWPHRVSFCRSY